MQHSLISLLIHTFIQIAFLWPVLKPLTCWTQISARYYMSHILISFNVSSRMSYLEKLFSICAKFLIYTSKLCTMFMYLIFYYVNKSPKKKYLLLRNVWSTSIQVYIVSVHIHIKTKVRHVPVHVLYIYVPDKGEKNNLDV